MAYLNKVMLIGNIGKDPEFRMSQTGGRKRVSFSLATSRRYRDNNGEQKEQTDWHNIVGWGKTADIIEQLGVHALRYRSQHGHIPAAGSPHPGRFSLLPGWQLLPGQLQQLQPASGWRSGIRRPHARRRRL